MPIDGFGGDRPLVARLLEPAGEATMMRLASEGDRAWHPCAARAGRLRSLEFPRPEYFLYLRPP